MQRTSLLRRIRIWLGGFALVGIPLGMGGQQKRPTLGEVLQRLEANLNAYDAGVPSFFCEEQVVSSRAVPKERDDRSTTDSVFRLRRTPQADAAGGWDDGAGGIARDQAG